jgi:hypothetical protein
MIWRPDMEGYIEFLSRACAKGWAHDPGEEGAAPVKAMVGGTILAEGIAQHL